MVVLFFVHRLLTLSLAFMCPLFLRWLCLTKLLHVYSFRYEIYMKLLINSSLKSLQFLGFYLILQITFLLIYELTKHILKLTLRMWNMEPEVFHIIKVFRFCTIYIGFYQVSISDYQIPNLKYSKEWNILSIMSDKVFYIL